MFTIYDLLEAINEKDALKVKEAFQFVIAEKCEAALNEKRIQVAQELVTEKFGKEAEINPAKKGMWDGWSVADLHKELAKAKAGESHKGTMKEIEFAIRAKTGWGKVNEEILNESLTKKHYEEIAAWAKKHIGPQTKAHPKAIDELANMLSKHNDSFNKQKFYTAAGWPARYHSSMDEETITEGLEGRRVELLNTRGQMKEFVGKTGRIGNKEGKHFRIHLDTPVHIPGVGKVKDDLWTREHFKLLKD